MTAAIRPLTRVQVGVETTAGSEVNGTRLLSLESASVNEGVTLHTNENQMTGLLERTFQASVPTRFAPEFAFSGPLDFTQILLPLLSGMDGGVTPTGSTAKIWTFLGAGIDRTTYTIETVASDGTNLDSLTATYGFTTEMEISGGLDATPTLSWSMVSRATSAKSAATGIALPTLVNIASPLAKIYIDGTWANLGTTQISGEILSWTWKMTMKGVPRFTIDGRAGLDLTGVALRPHVVDLSISILHNAANSGLVVQERAAKAAGTGRAVRVKLDDGVQIQSGPINSSVVLDGFYDHQDDSLPGQLGSDDDGELVTSLHLMNRYETSASKSSEVVVTNLASSFP
jgi:hypothetical protein